MRFIDYPDHLPLQQGPPSPEMLAFLARAKEAAQRLTVIIPKPYARTGRSVDVDLVVSLHRGASDSPLVCTVLKSRAPKEPTP